MRAVQLSALGSARILHFFTSVNLANALLLRFPGNVGLSRRPQFAIGHCRGLPPPPNRNPGAGSEEEEEAEKAMDPAKEILATIGDDNAGKYLVASQVRGGATLVAVIIVVVVVVFVVVVVVAVVVVVTGLTRRLTYLFVHFAEQRMTSPRSPRSVTLPPPHEFPLARGLCLRLQSSSNIYL